MFANYQRKKTKRFCSALALFLALLTLVSCAGSSVPVNPTDVPTTAPTATEAASSDTTAEPTPSAEPTAVVYRPDIPEVKYDYDFRVLVSDPSTVVWYDTDFSATEITSDIVNDAVYARNNYVQELLNITIVPVYANPVVTQIEKSTSAGDDDFDICFCNPISANSYIQGARFVNLYTVPNLNLSAEWWDQNAVQGLTVGGKLYLAAGDIGYNYLRSTSVIFFNKKMAEDAGLADPYQLVRDGEWTYETMFQMATDATVDMGGGGTDPAQDIMGMVYCGDTLFQMLIGAGVSFIKTSWDGSSLRLSFMDDETVDIFDRLTDFLYNQSANWDTSGVNASTQFLNGTLLFIPTEFWVISLLRDGLDFGVLPMPGYEAYQSRYYHVVNPNVAPFMMIPTTNRDLDRTGVVLEALAAEGKNTITPAYIEKSLISRSARDAESEETIRLIFGSLYFETGFLYNIGGIKETLTGMARDKRTDIASAYARREDVYNEELDKMLKKYQELP